MKHTRPSPQDLEFNQSLVTLGMATCGKAEGPGPQGVWVMRTWEVEVEKQMWYETW